MSASLADLATAAGVIHPSVLEMARPELGTPQQQLADLRKRFPGAFPKHARAMDADEYRAARDSATGPGRTALAAAAERIAEGKHASDMTRDEWHKARASVGHRRAGHIPGQAR